MVNDQCGLIHDRLSYRQRQFAEALLHLQLQLGGAQNGIAVARPSRLHRRNHCLSQIIPILIYSQVTGVGDVFEFGPFYGISQRIGSYVEKWPEYQTFSAEALSGDT